MVDYGWYFDPPSAYDDTVYVEYCGIIHNPNDKLIAEFPKLIVTIKNPDGTILATGDQTGSIIMPGDTITLCGMFPMPISDASDETQININWECDDFNTVSKLHEAVSSKELVVSNLLIISRQDLQRHLNLGDMSIGLIMIRSNALRWYGDKRGKKVIT